MKYLAVNMFALKITVLTAIRDLDHSSPIVISSEGGNILAQLKSTVSAVPLRYTRNSLTIF